MEIDFKCPACGVVTYFDSLNRGKKWDCRGCGAEVVISPRDARPQHKDPQHEGQAAGKVSEQEPAIDADEAEQEEVSRRGKIIVTIAATVMGLFIAGRAVLEMARYASVRNPPSSAFQSDVSTEQPMPDDRWSRKFDYRTKEDWKEIERTLLESDQVKRYSAEDIPQLPPR